MPHIPRDRPSGFLRMRSKRPRHIGALVLVFIDQGAGLDPPLPDGSKQKTAVDQQQVRRGLSSCLCRLGLQL